MRIKITAEVDATRIGDGSIYQIEQNQGFWCSFGSGSVFSKAEHCEELPEPITSCTHECTPTHHVHPVCEGDLHGNV